MKRFQLVLAEHPDVEFTTRELAEALDAEGGWNSIAGMLGAYGNRVRSRYGRSTFPFASRWDHELGQARHSMSTPVAEIIRALS
jgi:hypothetical protein